MRVTKKQFYLDSFESSKTNIKETWKLIGEVAGRIKPCSKLTNSFNIEGVISSNPQQIAEGFNRFFGTIGPKLASQIPLSSSADNNFRKYLGVPTEEVFSLNEISIATLLRHVDNLSPKTSCGSDLLSNKLLKLAVKSLLHPLLRLINLSFSTGFVPSQMTLSKVIPLHKEGPKDSFNNYRPIAITSSIGKLIEKIVCEQLCSYLDSNDILSNNQYGFRTNHSISHPLLHFSKQVLDSLSNNKLNLCTFIDLKKALDTVDLDIL